MMNKKKACIDSLAALQGHEANGQEPAIKVPRLDHVNISNHINPPGSEKSSDSSVIVMCNDQQLTQKDVPLAVDVNVDQYLPTSLPSSAEEKKLSHLNKDIFFNESLTLRLHSAFHSDSELVDGTTAIQLCAKPFRHCVLPNLITKSDYVTDLESALQDLPLRDKSNDLYKFSQSRDLNHSKSSTVSTFRTLCNTIRNTVSSITDIPLNSKIDLFCSKYKYTDALLCHDDELEERRVAFIYYLVPENWEAADGGALDLFDCDEYGQPHSIVKSIVPKRNSFLFFEVSPKSFHQVAEVLSEEKTRLSISGWFHGPRVSRPVPHVDQLPPAVSYGSIEEEVFYSWFNPLYLAPEVQTDIRKRFEEDSEIELTDFLQEAKYEELVSAMRSSEVHWSLLGPPNKRQYYAAGKSSLPPIVTEFLRVIHSDAVFLVLSNLTGLKLHSLAPLSDEEDGTSNGSANGDNHNPRCRSEVRKWGHGCYTLAHDTDPEVFDFALDSMFYIDCGNDWSFDIGGQTSYIAKGEEEELLSVAPNGNCLALVYRDKDTVRFVKHLNHRLTKMTRPQFYEINTVYYE